MNLKDVNIALGHKVTGGDQFLWSVFNDARFLDYGPVQTYPDTHNATVIYSTTTQEVFVAELYLSTPEREYAYRWISPSHRDAYMKEMKARNINPNIAFDDTNFVDLEVSEDWLEKATAIFNGQAFDERVIVPVDLDDDTFLKLAKLAHEKDITFNKLVEEALRYAIDEYKRDPENMKKQLKESCAE